MGGLAQREVEQDVVLARRRGPSRRRRRWSARSAARPAGPSGSPMSEAVSTSPASAPMPEPTWEASIAPTALPRMPMIGPAIALASSGRAPLRELTERSATGSTSTFHTSVVADDPLGAAPGRGRGDAGRERGGARRASGRPGVTASATASFCFWVGVGSGDWATDLAGQVDREVPVDGAVVGLHQRLDLAEERAQVGGPAAAEELLERRALEGVLAARVGAVGGRRPGCCSWCNRTRSTAK